jgi:alkaline phosphatase D
MLNRADLSTAVKSEGGISRRLFLAYSASLSAIPTAGLRVEGRVVRQPKVADNPFALGVASGDPDDTGFVLWTRLAPQPLAEGGGMPTEIVEVQWEVADDEGMKSIVRKGTALATPQLGHSLHVVLEGLKPDRWYFYRFHVGNATSPVGRARTMPEPGATPEKLRFAFASCQHYETGYYTAYEHMAKDDLDLVFHLGDYIYEYPHNPKRFVRKHAGPTKGKLKTLEDYRNRYAQYHTDPLLAAVHTKCPWVVTWDDHEFENNCAGAVSEIKGMDPVKFLEQRANAYQAYYENMPLRPQSVPQGPNLKLYRTISFGRLARFQVLDTRQYRSDQPNDDRASDLNEAAMDPKNSMLGTRQANWLKTSLLRSPATWNVLAQQVLMGMVDRTPGPERHYSMDKWTSCAYERIRLMEWIRDRKVPNPVVLTGDIHSNWVVDLRVDDRKVEEPVVATEFVGTSISSGGNGEDRPKDYDALLAENPCVKFHNRNRGYVRCTVTPKDWRSDYVVVENITTPGAPAKVRGSFVVTEGNPGAEKA